MIYLDATGTLFTPEDIENPPEGTETLLASLHNGSLVVRGRGADFATVEAEALRVGLLAEDEDGRVRPSTKNVLFVHEGPITEPGEAEEDPPVVIDARHHFSFWLDLRKVPQAMWVPILRLWADGEVDEEQNRLEYGLVREGITLIDPGSILSPNLGRTS